jgi:hypothetical protein
MGDRFTEINPNQEQKDTMRAQSRNNNLSVMFAIVGLAATANAQSIVNGDFESPAIADRTYQAVAPSSWSGGALLMNPNAAGGFSGNPFTWPQAQSGQQYDDIGNSASSSISQAFTIVASATYKFTWHDSTALNITPGFQTAPFSISLLNGFQPVLSQSFDSYHVVTWQLRAVSQALTPGTYTLTFSSLNMPNRTDTLIDNVVITPVPEPSSILITLCGVVGLCLHRHLLPKHERDAS